MRKFYPSVLSICIIATLIIPYLIAGQIGGDDYVFGGFFINPLDGNSYLAKMYLGFSGEWMFRLPYTNHAGSSGYMFLFYIALGHIARILNISPLLVFHIARIIGAIVLMLSLYKFLLRVFQFDRQRTNHAYAIAIIGSGMGWFAALLGQFTSDLWVAEAYPYLSMFVNPHFPLGLGLLLLFFERMLRVGANRGEEWLIFVGLATAIVMPFLMVIAAIIGGIYAIYSWMRKQKTGIVRLALFFLAGGPFMVYQYWVTLKDPYLKLWNVQNLTPAPAIWDFTVSFLPLLVLAVIGLIRVVREKARDDGITFLAIWLAFGCALVYFPFNLQRRFMAGLFIPVVGLAIYYLFQIKKVRIRKLLFLALIIFIPFTNLLIIGSGLAGAQSHPEVLYLSADENHALMWIRESTDSNSTILCAPDFGIFVPARSGRQVIYGHPFETIDAENKKIEVMEFYQQPDREEVINWLFTNQVDYILAGPREQKLNKDLLLDNFPIAYENETVKIYAVTP